MNRFLFTIATIALGACTVAAGPAQFVVDAQVANLRSADPAVRARAACALKDMGSKASFSIISMADQWKKMQEGITKDKDEKEIKEATKKTATFTEKTAKGIEVLIANFGPSTQTGAPLFTSGGV